MAKIKKEPISKYREIISSKLGQASRELDRIPFQDEIYIRKIIELETKILKKKYSGKNIRLVNIEIDFFNIFKNDCLLNRMVFADMGGGANTRVFEGDKSDDLYKSIIDFHEKIESNNLESLEEVVLKIRGYYKSCFSDNNRGLDIHGLNPNVKIEIKTFMNVYWGLEKLAKSIRDQIEK